MTVLPEAQVNLIVYSVELLTASYLWLLNVSSRCLFVSSFPIEAEWFLK